MVNQAFSDIISIPEHQLIGQKVSWLDDRIRKHLIHEKSLPNVDYSTPQNPDKQVLDIVLNGKLINLERIICFDPKNNGVGGIVYFRDISEQKNLEKMKSDFLSTAAHELRTPMANVYGYAELLLNSKFPQKTVNEMLEIIHNQVGRLVFILNDLLDLARIEAKGAGELTYSSQSPSKILLEASKLYNTNSEHHPIKLELNDTPKIECDHDKVLQVLNNILSNSIKYSPSGGEIRVNLIPEARLGTSGVLISIRDHGIGMTEEQQKMVFERFYRADTSGTISGTGLGMSIVKEIVDLHHGQIELKSIEGQGTIVNLWLPEAPLSISSAH